MKRLLTLSTFLLLSIVTFASTEVNGIYYEFSETEATVVKGTNKYTGSVTIPASVTYGEQTYSVTSIGTDAFRSCSGLTSITIPNSVTSIGNYAFQNCSGLTSVTIPNSVTSIGRCAFWGCSELTSIEIPNSVTSIGSDAFYGCSGLTSVTIPNSVTSIGSYAFSGTAWYGNQPDGLVYAGKVAYRYKGTMPENTSITIKDGTLGIGGDAFYECSGLTSVTIPNSVTSIGEDAFKNCSGLTSITIGGNVTSIGSGTFSGCSGLTSITIPNSVETIENHTFADCSSLTSVTIGENVTSIGNQAFKNCNKLTHIYIPNKVTSIDAYAFYGCSGLNSITIGNNVTNIGESAFQGCWGLTYVTIPKSVKSIGHRAFLYCNDITSIYCNIESPSNIGEIFEKSYYSNVTLYVPYGTRDEYQRTDGWRNFTNIKENLYYTFSGTEATVVSGANKYTGDVIIPASVTNGNQNYSVTRIYQKAFYGCTGLTSVTIPSSVTNIGTSAFEGCTGLETVTDNSSISIIEDRTFYGCSGLTSINIPSNVTSIGGSAFSGCSGLTSINIPSNVTSIGQSAFGGCTGLTSIKVQEGNTKYDSRNNCNAIIETASNTLIRGCKNTVIPNSVTSIGNSAFSGCSGLTSITIPNSVTSIGERAFQSCSGLTSITIPNSVTSIGERAFQSCSGLTSITIPNSVTSIGEWAFSNCSGLTSITIPNSVTSIGNYAFDDCSGLTSITIPNSVTSIGYRVFQRCSGLTSITIPNSVTSIENYAFSGCSGLVSIYSYIENPTSAPGSNFDSSNYTNATLYVLKGKKNEYLATDGWKNFVKITEFAPTYTLTYKVDGATYKTYQVAYGSAITPETAPTKTGYTFSGWSGIPATMPAHNVEVYGKFYNPEDYKTIESAWVDASLGGTYAVPVTAGTVIASSASIDMFQAFDDSFKAVSMTGEADVANQITIDGVTYPVNEHIGLQAQINATPNNLGTATEGAWVGGQNSGAVFGFNVKKDGLLCVFGRFTATKQYYAWEGDVTNSVASLAAYRLVGHGVAAVDGVVPTCDYTLPAAEGSNIADADAMTANPDKWLKSSNVIAAAQVIDPNFVSGNALGVLVVPVYAEAETYYVNACGSRITSNGFVFIPKAAPTAADAANISVTFSKKALPTYNLTYKVDGEIYKQYKLAEGDAITPEPAPTKEGYTFSGWSEIPATMPASDVTVTGTFTAIPVPEPSSDNALAISNAETYAGKQVVLPIDMNNVASIQAFQFDLYLPEGITIAKDEESEDMIDLTSRAAKSHTVAYSKQADGAIRMVCTSMSGATFKGNEGAIMNITLNVASDMAEGNYDIEIKKIELSDGTPYNPADIKATLTVKTYSPGDTDGNGKVTVNDAVCIINYILGTPSEGFVEVAADLDGSGNITVNDVVILINDYILGGNSQNSLDLNLEQVATADEDYLYINDINMKAGETREVEVYMNTARTDIQGLQCDIYLPEGMEFVYEEDGDERYYADAGGRAARSHSVAAKVQADGALRVVETSTSGAKFKNNDQAVFVFQIKAKNDMPAGNAEIKLGNVELSYGGAPINPSDRTSVVVIDDTPTGVDAIEANEASSSFVGKFIKDNKIIIMKHGKKHSVCGQEM